jgi:hypothetical protein
MTLRNIAIAVLMLALVGCASDGSMTPQAQQTATAVCAKDAALQPLAVADVPAISALAAAYGAEVPAAIGTTTVLDQAVVHPFVQQLCAQVPAAAAPVVPVPAGS